MSKWFLGIFFGWLLKWYLFAFVSVCCSGFFSIFLPFAHVRKYMSRLKKYAKYAGVEIIPSKEKSSPRIFKFYKICKTGERFVNSDWELSDNVPLNMTTKQWNSQQPWTIYLQIFLQWTIYMYQHFVRFQSNSPHMWFQR